MRQNARKLKPNPSNNQRCNIRSSSIRDIIGDRRFNDQFSNVNTNQNEGTKKVKKMKSGDGEVHDFSNLVPNASSNQSETTEDPRGCYGDVAAKTSEYAFYKRMKENTCSNVHVHPNDHDNQLNNDQHNQHLTSKEIPNVQKDDFEYARSSLPNDKEQNEINYSFLSPPCCGSKKSVVDNVFGVNDTNAQNVKPGEYNWLSPSVSNKTKSSGNKCVFSAKREKLRRLATNRSLYNPGELSSDGFDLVSALISRILPAVQDDNSHRDLNQGEIDYNYNMTPFSESESAAKIKNYETYKTKLIESQSISYLDDGFLRPTTNKLMNKNLLEWNPTGLESFSCDHSLNFSTWYNQYQTDGYKRESSRSTKKPIDMDINNIMEWNPTTLESRIQQNHHRPAGGFRIQNFDMESILSFNEHLLPMNESRNFQESHFYHEPKFLEKPQTLLLGWDQNCEKDESFLPSSSTSPHSSPYITRHLKKQHLLTSSIMPFTPEHYKDDCSFKFPLKDSSDENQQRCSESFLYLIQSPVNKFIDTGLHSIVADDEYENDDNFLYGCDRLLEGRVNDYGSFSYIESFVDKDFDHTEYPLLLP